MKKGDKKRKTATAIPTKNVHKGESILHEIDYSGE